MDENGWKLEIPILSLWVLADSQGGELSCQFQGGYHVYTCISIDI